VAIPPIARAANIVNCHHRRRKTNVTVSDKVQRHVVAAHRGSGAESF